MLLVVPIDELERSRGRLALPFPRHHDTQRHEVVTLRLRELWLDDGDEYVARDDLRALHVHRLEVEEPERTYVAHDVGVTRIPQRLVLHARDFSFVAERHRRQPARRVKRLELSDGRVEAPGLDLGERLDLCALSAANHPGERRVVVERALE